MAACLYVKASGERTSHDAGCHGFALVSSNMFGWNAFSSGSEV